MVKQIWIVLAWIGLTYGLLFAFAFYGSDRLIFQPQPSSYSDNPQILKLKTQTGITLAALYLPNPGSTHTILHSHGNGEDLGQVLPLLNTLQKHGFSVFAYDYPGYGISEGVPSEQTANQAIDTAYAYLTQELGIPGNRIIAHGRSVGGGPTLDLAVRQPLAGVIVESSFVSVFRVAIPFALLPFDKFRNLDKIKQVRVPVLIIHGTDDQTIPFWHGEQLFEQTIAPKYHLWVEGANHNDLIAIAGDQYFNAIWNFAHRLPRPEPTD